MKFAGDASRSIGFILLFQLQLLREHLFGVGGSESDAIHVECGLHVMDKDDREYVFIGF